MLKRKEQEQHPKRQTPKQQSLYLYITPRREPFACVSARKARVHAGSGIFDLRNLIESIFVRKQQRRLEQDVLDLPNPATTTAPVHRNALSRFCSYLAASRAVCRVGEGTEKGRGTEGQRG